MAYTAGIMSEDLEYTAHGRYGFPSLAAAQTWAERELATRPRTVAAPAGEPVAWVTRGDPDGCCNGHMLGWCREHLAGLTELVSDGAGAHWA